MSAPRAGTGGPEPDALRRAVYWGAFLAAFVVGVAVIAYNLYGSLTLTPIPPGRMSVLSYIGLKDLQRGAVSPDALDPAAILAYILSRFGLNQFTATKGAALLVISALPLAGGLYSYVITKSKLVGGATALILSVLPLSYLPALGGDYAFVAAVSLVQLTVLFSLLSVRSKRIPLTALWFVLAAVCAGLTGLTMSSASWLLLLTSASWGAWCLATKRWSRSIAAIIPGVVALVTNVAYLPNDPGEALRLISPAVTLSQYQLLLAVLGFAGAAGAASMVYRMRIDAAPAVAFVAAGLVLLPAFGAQAVVLVYPGVVVLGMFAILEYRGALAVVREAGPPGKEPVTLEIGLEKAVAFCFAMTLLVSPLVVGFGPASAVQGSNYLGNEELQTINQVSALNPSVFGTGLVAAPSSIAPWLRADLGVNAMLALSPNDSAVADAITSTSFRLRNSYLMMDEWTPFSSLRTPFVYAFDGATYGAILHLDDGADTVTLASGANESLGGTYLVSHSFSQNDTEMTLTLLLNGLGFNVTKQLTLSTANPTLEISYTVVADPGSKPLSSMTVPVYIEGSQKISDRVSGSSMALTMSSANLTLSFAGGAAPKLVLGAPQDHVQSTFMAKAGVIHASVSMTFRSAKSSGQGPFYSSLIDTLQGEGVSSLLTFAPQPGQNYLGGAIVNSTEALDIKDAFNRILLTSGGVNYVEAPSGAQVLSQNITSSCDGAVSYKTAGLIIQKDYSFSGGALSLSYGVHPWKAGATLDEMNVTLWVPTDRAILGYSVGSSSVSLRLDSGTVQIAATNGTMTGAEVGPDPVFGQDRVVMEFAMSGTSGTAGVRVSVPNQAACQSILTSRPQESGSDEIQLYTVFGYFQQVFSNNVFAIYRVDPAALP